MKKDKIAKEFQLDHELLVRKLSENGYHAEWTDVQKSNGIISGLIIFLEDEGQNNNVCKAAPVYYPDLMFQEADEIAHNIDEFTQRLIRLHEDCCKKFVKQPISLMDRDYLLAHLSVILAPMDEPTSSAVCSCELAGVKAILCADTPEGMFGIPEKLLKELKIKKENAWNTAITHAKSDRIVCNIEMRDGLASNMFDQQFVITRDSDTKYGAEAILGIYDKNMIYLDRALLMQIANLTESDQLILMPAGTQGIFTIPCKEDCSTRKEMLRATTQILRQLNYNGKALGDVISDELSVYDTATNSIILMEKYEEV